MMRGLYKKIDRATVAWDLDCGGRRYVVMNDSRRKLKRKLRRMARKKINTSLT